MNKFKYCICFIIIFYFMVGCKMNDINLNEYIDGNGNIYKIIKEKDEFMIEYIPVKIEESSSGLYSGGEHQIKKIEKSKYNSIIAIVKAAVKSNDFYENREKGTGLLILFINSEQKELILKSNSKYKKEIEDALKDNLF